MQHTNTSNLFLHSRFVVSQRRGPATSISSDGKNSLSVVHQSKEELIKFCKGNYFYKQITKNNSMIQYKSPRLSMGTPYITLSCFYDPVQCEYADGRRKSTLNHLSIQSNKLFNCQVLLQIQDLYQIDFLQKHYTACNRRSNKKNYSHRPIAAKYNLW